MKPLLRPKDGLFPCRGYTLVEVLTVCAIIGILAALSFPSLVGGIKNSRRAKCANNLRQIGIAFEGFAHDHNDRYPQQVPVSEGGSREQNLEAPVLNGQYILSPLAFRAVSSTFESAQVMVCPATKLWVPSFAALSLSNLCYALNLQAEPGNANIVLASDSTLLGDWVKLAKSIVDPNQTSVSFSRERHDSKGNVLFGDGHVELRKAVEAPPEALATAARTVSLLNRPTRGDGGSTGPATPPTERERQAAYEQAHPNHYAKTVASLQEGSGAVPGGLFETNLSGLRERRVSATTVKVGAAATNAPEATLRPAAVGGSEAKLQHTLLWLWLLLMLIGALMIWWHFHRQRQRAAERTRRWQQVAAEHAAEREERQALRLRTGRR